MSDLEQFIRGTAMTTTLETTLGDLICAISEAVEETLMDERDQLAVTNLILNRILKGRPQ